MMPRPLADRTRKNLNQKNQIIKQTKTIFIMSNIIVNPKNYTGHELETIFFRPLLTGPSAESLGIRILYNMPMPTVVQMWDHSNNVLDISIKSTLPPFLRLKKFSTILLSTPETFSNKAF